jgi:hypothetical protein
MPARNHLGVTVDVDDDVAPSSPGTRASSTVARPSASCRVDETPVLQRHLANLRGDSDAIAFATASREIPIWRAIARIDNPSLV